MDNEFESEEVEDNAVRIYLAYPKDEEKPTEVSVIIKDPDGMTGLDFLNAVKYFVELTEGVTDALFKESTERLDELVMEDKVIN